MAPKRRINKKKQRAVSAKIRENTREMNAGQLHSGSKTGPLVRNRAQAIAISYSQVQRKKKRRARK